MLYNFGGGHGASENAVRGPWRKMSLSPPWNGSSLSQPALRQTECQAQVQIPLLTLGASSLAGLELGGAGRAWERRSDPLLASGFPTRTLPSFPQRAPDWAARELPLSTSLRLRLRGPFCLTQIRLSAGSAALTRLLGALELERAVSRAAAAALPNQPRRKEGTSQPRSTCQESREMISGVMVLSKLLS